MEKVRTEPLETPRTDAGGFADGNQAGPFGGGRSPAGEPEAEERAALAGEEPLVETPVEPVAETPVVEPPVETEPEPVVETETPPEPPVEPPAEAGAGEDGS